METGDYTFAVDKGIEFFSWLGLVKPNSSGQHQYSDNFCKRYPSVLRDMVDANMLDPEIVIKAYNDAGGDVDQTMALLFQNLEDRPQSERSVHESFSTIEEEDDTSGDEDSTEEFVYEQSSSSYSKEEDFDSNKGEENEQEESDTDYSVLQDMVDANMLDPEIVIKAYNDAGGDVDQTMALLFQNLEDRPRSERSVHESFSTIEEEDDTSGDEDSTEEFVYEQSSSSYFEEEDFDSNKGEENEQEESDTDYSVLQDMVDANMLDPEIVIKAYNDAGGDVDQTMALLFQNLEDRPESERSIHESFSTIEEEDDTSGDEDSTEEFVYEQSSSSYSEEEDFDSNKGEENEQEESDTDYSVLQDMVDANMLDPEIVIKAYNDAGGDVDQTMALLFQNLEDCPRSERSVHESFSTIEEEDDTSGDEDSTKEFVYEQSSSSYFEEEDFDSNKGEENKQEESDTDYSVLQDMVDANMLDPEIVIKAYNDAGGDVDQTMALLFQNLEDRPRSERSIHESFSTIEEEDDTSGDEDSTEEFVYEQSSSSYFEEEDFDSNKGEENEQEESDTDYSVLQDMVDANMLDPEIVIKAYNDAGGDVDQTMALLFQNLEDRPRSEQSVHESFSTIEEEDDTSGDEDSTEEFVYEQSSSSYSEEEDFDSNKGEENEQEESDTDYSVLQDMVDANMLDPEIVIKAYNDAGGDVDQTMALLFQNLEDRPESKRSIHESFSTIEEEDDTSGDEDSTEEFVYEQSSTSYSEEEDFDSNKGEENEQEESDTDYSVLQDMVDANMLDPEIIIKAYNDAGGDVDQTMALLFQNLEDRPRSERSVHESFSTIEEEDDTSGDEDSTEQFVYEQSSSSYFEEEDFDSNKGEENEQEESDTDYSVLQDMVDANMLDPEIVIKAYNDAGGDVDQTMALLFQNLEDRPKSERSIHESFSTIEEEDDTSGDEDSTEEFVYEQSSSSYFKEEDFDSNKGEENEQEESDTDYSVLQDMVDANMLDPEIVIKAYNDAGGDVDQTMALLFQNLEDRPRSERSVHESFSTIEEEDDTSGDEDSTEEFVYEQSSSSYSEEEDFDSNKGEENEQEESDTDYSVLQDMVDANMLDPEIVIKAYNDAGGDVDQTMALLFQNLEDRPESERSIHESFSTIEEEDDTSGDEDSTEEFVYEQSSSSYSEEEDFDSNKGEENEQEESDTDESDVHSNVLSVGTYTNPMM